MSHESLPDPSKRREYSLHATSFTAFPSDLKPVLRSYSEIRKQMHQSLQARLNRDYTQPRPVILPTRSEAALKKPPMQYARSPSSFALSQIKVEAKLKTLAVRVRPDISLKVRSAQPGLRAGSADASRQRTATQSVISVKEAVRDREWLGRAREGILRSVAGAINESNGVGVVVPQVSESYKYYIRKGNNSKLLNLLLKSRPWWVRVKSKSEAQFIWSISRESKFISSLPKVPVRAYIRVDRSKLPLDCSQKYPSNESRIGKTVNIKPLGFGLITESPSFVRICSPVVNLNPKDLRIHNRLEANYHLTHKKALYRNMRQFYGAVGRDYTEVMPLTFHIVSGESDPEFGEFMTRFEQGERDASSPDHNFWILKPGENSNQGRDILVCSSLDQVRTALRSPIDRKTGKQRTFIVQKYIERPFLYNGRKFDVRCYGLVTTVNGVVQGYFYQEGYLRTSSKDFTLSPNWDKFVHLTNDAVQKLSDDYGKYEPANKLSYSDFQKYLDSHCPELQTQFCESVVGKIRGIVQDTMKATFWKLDPKRRNACFEVFGYDFMLDSYLNPILIEVNTNPCLALVCPLLFRLIPAMLDNALHLVIDSLYPDYLASRRGGDGLQENRWELIFHELVDGKALVKTLRERGTLSLMQEIDSIGIDYDDSGDEDVHDNAGN